MRTRIEDAKEIAVGQFYDVPMVAWRTDSHIFGHCKPTGFPDCIPIMGPLHNDAEFIGFAEDHWHIDWRFVDNATWNRGVSFGRSPSYQLARPISLKNIDQTRGVFRGRRKCRREMPKFAGGGQWSSYMTPRASWLAKLEEAYQHTNARCGICPHRGMPLLGAPVENGARVCPAHGLAWNVETGALQRRDGRTFEQEVSH